MERGCVLTNLPRYSEYGHFFPESLPRKKGVFIMNMFPEPKRKKRRKMEEGGGGEYS